MDRFVTRRKKEKGIETCLSTNAGSDNATTNLCDVPSHRVDCECESKDKNQNETSSSLDLIKSE